MTAPCLILVALSSNMTWLKVHKVGQWPILFYRAITMACPAQLYFTQSAYGIIYQNKVNSVQEACAKCFAIHLLKFEILQTT